MGNTYSENGELSGSSAPTLSGGDGSRIRTARPRAAGLWDTGLSDTGLSDTGPRAKGRPLVTAWGFSVAMTLLFISPPVVYAQLPESRPAGGTAALEESDLPYRKAEEPLGDGVIARVDGQDITLDDYKDFLFTQTQLDRFLLMVDDLLLRKKATELEVEISEEELDEQVERNIQDSVDRIHGGDREAFELALNKRFRSIETHRNWQKQLLRSQILVDRCVRRLRKITPEDVKREFEKVYGPGGIHLQVSHILLPRNRPGESRDIEAEANRILERLEADPKLFADMVQEHSGDAMTKRNNGFIANYRPALYGAEFHRALQELTEGEIGGPLRSGYGLHIVQLLKRTVTTFEEVEEEIRLELERQAPTPREKAMFRSALRAESKIEM